MAGVIATIPKFQFSANGAPLVGGTLTTYLAGSSTPATTWQDQALGSANTNPITLDARGECVLWLDSTKSYKFVLTNASGVTQWTQDNITGTPNLGSSTGAAFVGFTASGASAVASTVQAKLRELTSVRDYGGVLNGVADDTAAIASARAVVSTAGGSVIYGGKTYSPGFWENMAPLAQEWVKGSPTAYATDIVVSKPLISAKLFNGTPLAGSGAGFAGYGQRTDCYTKAGVDVASSVAGLFSMQSYSTNSTGANFNDTYQVALVANSSAMDAASSASVEAFNAITFSGYTGALAQQMVGSEVDIGANRAPGWFGDANKTYGVGYTANVAGGNSDVTVAYACNTTDTTKAFLHGAVLAGVRYTGLTVARNGAITPETGIWVSSAQTYGVYIGAKSKWPLNSGSLADYTYKPVIGLALGQEGATSAKSHTLRLTSTSAASAEQNADVFIDAAGNLQVQFNGANVFTLAAAGTLSINGTQVLAGRRTGYVAMSGASDSGSAMDTATVTLVQLAQRVASLQASLTQMGILGT